MRRFHSYGPVNARSHFSVPRTDLVNHCALDHLSLDQVFALDERVRFNSVLSSEAYGGKNRLYLYESSLLTSGSNQIPVQISAAVLTEAEVLDGDETDRCIHFGATSVSNT